MRRAPRLALGARLLGLVAALVAIPALWINATLLDTSGYVDAVGPVASEEAVQAAVVREVSAALGEDVPPAARRLVERQVRVVVASAAFERQWTQAQRRAHRVLVRVLDGEGDTVVLELDPVARTVTQRLRRAGLAVDDLPPGTVRLEVLRAAGLAPARRASDWVEPVARAAPFVAGLLLLVGVVLARRRGRALAWTGLGLVGVACALAVAAVALRARVVDELAASAAPQDVGTAVLDALLSPLLEAVIGLAAVGGFVAVVGALVARRARTVEGR